MKRIAILSILILASIITYAQTDISALEGISPEEIISIMGTPDGRAYGETEANPTDFERLSYVDTEAGFNYKYRTVSSFQTSSDRYSILSNIVPGGIHVGGRLSDLKEIEFRRTEYGRNDDNNELRPYDRPYGTDIQDCTVNYIIFSEEFRYIKLCVDEKSDRILAWGYFKCQDVPYMPYDFSIKMW